MVDLYQTSRNLYGNPCDTVLFQYFAPMSIRFSILILMYLFPTALVVSYGQKKNDGYRYQIKKAEHVLVIDGVGDEQDWSRAQVAGSFYMVLPMDTSSAELRTDVRMTYDDEHLYIYVENYHGGWNYMVESLRRDWNFGRNDNFIFFLDTYDDQTNGFAFGANAAGAQWDGMMSEGSKVDLSWDNKWVSVNKTYKNHWTFEAAIPFKSIRYKKGITHWGVNFSRNDLVTTEKSSWAPVPRQFPTASLAFTGNLEWDQPPPDPGTNISVIPYALAGRSKDFQSDASPALKKEFGGDAKIALTSALNLDLTLNPDFSQVEVDRQVTNLDRFELFFPERRQFFLENGDIFATMGYKSLRPFFSRRIGLGVPIKYGARLSGKLNRNWRIGAMDMVTDAVESKMLPQQNFATLALQRRVFSRSYVSAMFINKSSMNDQAPTADGSVYSAYNRNLGLEYNLQSADNKWNGKALYMKSWSPAVRDKDIVSAGHLQYNDRKWMVYGQYEFVGENYNPEVGYVPRRGYLKINPEVTRLFFPKGGSILSHAVGLSTERFFDPRLIGKAGATRMQMDQETYMGYLITYRSRSTLRSWVAQNHVRLYNKFDPTNSGKDFLAVGSEHVWRSFGMEYTSKPQRLLTWSGSFRYGGYYAEGERLNLAGEIAYRFQPYAALSIAGSYNSIRLPAPWNRVNFLLLSPRLDVTMTNKLYLTAFGQYNDQAKNVNLNMRLQWRYSPASDLFVVYTDNYLPEDFSVKNRAIVVKWTYWWNL